MSLRINHRWGYKYLEIERSLSNKGCPYDNAAAESLYNILKTEFVKGKDFENIDILRLELGDYVNWYNNHRLHGSLDYLTPMEYKEKKLEVQYFGGKIPYEFVTI